jgi:hypothetical protein
MTFYFLLFHGYNATEVEIQAWHFLNQNEQLRDIETIEIYDKVAEKRFENSRQVNWS